MKKPEVYLKEYCQRLSDESLKFLAIRFNQKLFGDMAEVLEFLSGVREIDRWLTSAETSDEMYVMVDMIQVSILKEAERRSSTN